MASLHDRIAELQADVPWGSVLNSGIECASMGWLLAQRTEQWTVVTGSTSIAKAVQRQIGGRVRPLSDWRLAAALRRHVQDLRKTALAETAAQNGIHCGYDYIIAAEPVNTR